MMSIIPRYMKSCRSERAHYVQSSKKEVFAMDEKLEEKAVEQIKLRTALNFLAAFIGLLIPFTALTLYRFISDIDTFLTYHNETQGNTESIYYVDTGYMIFCGIAGGVAAAVIAVLAVLLFRRFKRIDNKVTAAAVSAAVVLVCILPGYFLSYFLFP